MRARRTIDLFTRSDARPSARRGQVLETRGHEAARGAGNRSPRPTDPQPQVARRDEVLGPAGGASRAPATELWVGVHLAGAAAQCAPQGLQRLALRALRFTPRVSLAPPDGLLLEVRASLHLFGGVEGLRRALRRECADLAIAGSLAFAPTPLAALAAARCECALVLQDAARLIGSLAPLPLRVLRWPQEALDRLASIGVHTIGQVLRLPRAGFAQRFGAVRLADLDRLTGRAPDPRERFEAPVRFRRRRELPCESASHGQLTAALAPLIEALGRFLEARQCGVLAIECRLWHRHAEPTRCVLRLAAPLADAARLAELLGERLRMLALPEPAHTCELRAGEPVPRALCSSGLWQSGEHGGLPEARGSAFIERLRARLGPEAVQGLAVVSDHRPEAAGRVTEPGACWGSATARSREKPFQPARPDRSFTACGEPPGAGPRFPASPATSRQQVSEAQPIPLGRSPPRDLPLRDRSFAPSRIASGDFAAARPLWLLPVPRPLRQRGGVPRYRGALRLESEPERIETGWWDGRDIERDYYEAVDVHGRRLWLFRERAAPHRWFLQGVFA